MSTRRASVKAVTTFRNTRADAVEPSSVTASEAKATFGRVLERAMRDGAVVITKHDTAKAVLLSIERFNALSAGDGATLETLDREFDALLTRMQTPKAKRGMKAAFAASGARLGRAAAAARRRG
jgi:prevent-host-death family protein